ncbi:succinate dehydrogenase [Chlamydiifrater volucris]|uniref:succinate dehydrogenase n=1 Tax=Chlamydiifrater volucris TaxID=2681470 RepID=UPI0032B2D975
MYEKSKKPCVAGGRFSFFLRVLHSISGVAFTFFLCEHLLTNFLASSFGGNGKFFVALVNRFHAIPGLKFIEIFCLALPFMVHAIIGVVYAINGRFNTHSKYGNTPKCNFARNHAYVWQRVTAWALLLAVGFHVVHMRFVLYPSKVEWRGKFYFAVTSLGKQVLPTVGETAEYQVLVQKERLAFPDELEKNLANEKVLILASSAGKAFHYIVRKALASLWVAILYTILVLTSVFHGFNGLWTFCSRWGVVETARQQKILRLGIYGIIIPIFSILGVYTIWSLHFAF